MVPLSARSYHPNTATPLSSLGRCIIQREIHWEDAMTVVGEYCHFPGYWEWTENISVGAKKSWVQHKFMMFCVSFHL